MQGAGERAPADQPLAARLRGWLADASGKLFGGSSGRAELPRRNNGAGKARASLAGDPRGAREKRTDHSQYGISAGFGAQAPPCLPRPQCFGAFCLPDAQVMCMAVLLDGRIACGCDDGTILLVHVHTRSQPGGGRGERAGEPRSSLPLDAHRGGDMSQPGEYLAHRHGVHSTGNCHAGISQTLNLHTAGVTSLCILPSDGHCRMASASWDGTVRVWDVSLLGSSPCVSVLRLSADDVNARQCARYGIRNADGATCLAFDEVRGFLWAGSSSGLIKIWDVVDGTEVCVLQKAHDRAVSYALYLDPSDALATAGADCMIRIWSAASQQCLITLMGHTGPVEALGLCPHSMRLFSSSSCDSTVRSWALEEDEERDTEEGEQEQARRKREDVEKERGVGGGVGLQAEGLDHEPWLDGDEDGGGVRAGRKRGKTCGPMSTLAAHILDPTNPTSAGYVTAGQKQGTKLT